MLVATETALPEISPTATPFPVASTPFPTVPPTATPLPTATVSPQWTPTATQLPCNASQFIADVTVPDGSLFAPDVRFTKVWRMKNTGICTWTTDYDLVFSSGVAMTTKNTVVALPTSVKPGETVDISVELKTPLEPGTYSGFWKLRSNANTLFGAGSQNSPVTVQVRVLNVREGVNFDFILNACAAEWRNSHNDPIPCQGQPSNPKGLVQILDNLRLENRTENEPTLQIRPDDRYQGFIKGTFPAYTIKEGDYFKSWIGCLYDNQGCKVKFQLQARMEDGTVVPLGTWQESYDGNITVIELALSDLVGEKVQFILIVTVENYKPEKANAFWFVPRIETID